MRYLTIKGVVYFTLSIGFCHAQIDKIRFEYGKTRIKKSDYVKLDSLATIVKNEEMKLFSVKLVNLSCQEEWEKNKKIGALRAIEIIDYMEVKHKLSRSKFYYVDSHIETYDKLHCKDFSHIEVHLTRE